MSSFDKKQQGEERKFVRDAEFRFKATARRDRLLGLWIGELLGKSEEEARAFATEVVKSNFERPGDDDVVEFVLKSAADGGVELSEHRLRHKMEELQAEAEQQLAAE